MWWLIIAFLLFVLVVERLYGKAEAESVLLPVLWAIRGVFLFILSIAVMAVANVYFDAGWSPLALFALFIAFSVAYVLGRRAT